MAVYPANSLFLIKAGVQVDGPVHQVFNGQEVEVWSRTAWNPKWGLKFSDVKNKVSGSCSISQRSTMAIKGLNVFVEDLSLDGALLIESVYESEVKVGGSLQNKGWILQNVYCKDTSVPEEIRIRGFKINKIEQLEKHYSEPGKFDLKANLYRDSIISFQDSSILLNINVAEVNGLHRYPNYSLVFWRRLCNMLNAKDLHRIFQKLDKNGDGLLSLEELNRLLEGIGVNFSLEELEYSVGKTSLNFDEFLLFYDSITKQNDDKNEILEEKDEEQDLAKAFNVFDLNGDGFISCEELQSVLARLGLWDETSGKDCRSMIYVYDTNLDGVLDFQEFKNMMLHAN